jgi:hypothetical protein
VLYRGICVESVLPSEYFISHVGLPNGGFLK